MRYKYKYLLCQYVLIRNYWSVMVRSVQDINKPIVAIKNDMFEFGIEIKIIGASQFSWPDCLNTESGAPKRGRQSDSLSS